jgi:hypothetical protein
VTYQIYGAWVSNAGVVNEPAGLGLTLPPLAAAELGNKIAPSLPSQSAGSLAGQSAGQMLLTYTRFDPAAPYGNYRVRTRILGSGAPIATMCTSNEDCETHACSDGYCCDRACTGACETCGATPGSCTPVVKADDPDTCAAACANGSSTCQAQSTCNAASACTLVNGQGALSGTSCESGFASGGVCCDQACTGGCSTCTAPSSVGTCTALTQGNAGINSICTRDGGAGNLCDGMDFDCPLTCTSDADCPSGHFCHAGGTCMPQATPNMACNPMADCASLATCTECAVTNICAVASCDSDAGTTAVVATTGAGKCLANATVESRSCGGFGCDGTACKTKCATTSDCASGYSCDVATGKCAAAAICLDPHTAQDITGNKTNCSPYICSAGACENKCTSVADCVGGFICDSSGSCVTASTSPASSSSGCSCDAVGGRSRRGWSGLGVLAALIVARRRRRRSV